MHYDPAAMAGL